MTIKYDQEMERKVLLDGKKEYMEKLRGCHEKTKEDSYFIQNDKNKMTVYLFYNKGFVVSKYNGEPQGEMYAEFFNYKKLDKIKLTKSALQPNDDAGTFYSEMHLTFYIGTETYCLTAPLVGSREQLLEIYNLLISKN